MTKVRREIAYYLGREMGRGHGGDSTKCKSRDVSGCDGSKTKGC